MPDDDTTLEVDHVAWLIGQCPNVVCHEPDCGYHGAAKALADALHHKRQLASMLSWAVDLRRLETNVYYGHAKVPANWLRALKEAGRD